MGKGGKRRTNHQPIKKIAGKRGKNATPGRGGGMNTFPITEKKGKLFQRRKNPPPPHPTASFLKTFSHSKAIPIERGGGGKGRVPDEEGRGHEKAYLPSQKEKKKKSVRV